MKILYFHKFNLNSGWGGSATVLRALYTALTGLGCTVDVVSARRPDRFGFTSCALPYAFDLTFGPEKRAGEVTIDELSSEQIERMAAEGAERVEAELLANGLPDLILANHINLMALIAWRLARKYAIPYRIIAYGTDTQLLLRDARYLDLFGRAARDAERIFPISRFVAREVEATVGGRIEVMGGAVDKSLFYLPPPTHPPGQGLVYFGRLVTEKGLWPLLEAFDRQRSAATLTLVGEGPLRAELEAYCRRHPSGRIELVAYQTPDKLREILIGAALAVVPSIWAEPLGLVVLEAMACGLPVVATEVGGITEMIDDGVNGRLVPPGDPTAFATAIDAVLGDDATHARMRQAVRRTPIRSYEDLARQVIG